MVRRDRKRQKAAQYGRTDMMTLARRVRLLIKVVGSLLFAVFAFLQIKDLQIKPIIEDINPDSAKRFILSFTIGAGFSDAHSIQTSKNSLTTEGKASLS
jgi:hypothetical protein